MKLGYLKQFVSLFGIKHGVALYLKLSFKKTEEIRLPQLKHPISLRKGTTDLRVFYQIFVNKEYDMSFSSNCEVIIDGGANIGLFAVLMANKYPDSTIIAIEPETRNFNQLLRNAQFYPNIQCLQKGIWNKEVKLSIESSEEYGEWGFITKEDENGNIEAVSITNVMEMYKLSTIDVLKLDIETSEKEVFEEGYEDWLLKTRMLIVELHDGQRKGCAKSFFRAVNSQLVEYDYFITGENTVIVNNSLE